MKELVEAIARPSWTIRDVQVKSVEGSQVTSGLRVHPKI